MDPLSIAAGILSGAYGLWKAARAKALAFGNWLFTQKLNQDVTLSDNANNFQEKIDALGKVEHDILDDLRS